MSRQPNTDREEGPDPRAMIIAEAATGGTAPAVDPQTLPLADLHTVPEVFQMRHALISLTRFDQTVTALLQVIRQGVTLDPLRVWWSGARWIVLDGHHRHEAYRADAAGGGTPEAAYSVPVSAFAGSLDEAILEAGRENAKVRNTTTGPERNEWAWRLMASGTETSPTALAQAAGISRMQANRMRKRKAELLAEGMTPDEMVYRGWHRCRSDGGKTMMDPDDVEAFRARMEETADRLEKALVGEFGGTWHRNAPAFAHAFATRAPQFAKVLVNSDALWPLVQEVQRVEREAEAEEAAELADRVGRNSGAGGEDPICPF